MDEISATHSRKIGREKGPINYKINTVYIVMTNAVHDFKCLKLLPICLFSKKK